MLLKNSFPILEFDSNPKAKIEPSDTKKQLDVPEVCVITFFGEVIEKMAKQGLLKQITELRAETLRIPVYETVIDDKRVGIVIGYVCAAGSAAMLEELIAIGFKKFFVCGGAGVLKKDIQVGHLILPYSAVRDEGVSYHYIEPSREVECNKRALLVIEEQLIKTNLLYIKAKTWTTDGIYRETEDKIALRASEGCVTVEMEAAAFFAVAQFRNVILGQILYAGDDLSGEEWDNRQWHSREYIRQNLVDFCLHTALLF